MNRHLVSASLLLAIACSSPTGPLDVKANPASLRLTNSSATPVYYFIVERQTAALINWALCADPVACVSVPPHGQITVPYEQIAGYTSQAREAIVYWWHLEASDGQFRADSVRALVVRL
jgi:hypothetical protein